jgi:hypothetical protein
MYVAKPQVVFTKGTETMIVRSVRYKQPTYIWLVNRAEQFNRSVQKENTYLLDLLRNRPDVLAMLEREKAEKAK